MSSFIRHPAGPASPHRQLDLAEQVIRDAGRERPADAVLRGVLKAAKLSPSDAARVSRLVFSYYRWLGWTDADQPLADQLRHALTLADQFAAGTLKFAAEELKHLAVPEWVAGHLPVTLDWVKAIQTEPRPWLRCKRSTVAALRQRFGITQAQPLPEAIRYEGTEDLFRLPEFHAGDFELQDITSQAVGLIAGPQPGETWWDTCAGEGGKTLHLADLMHPRGLVWASDRAEWRLKALKRRAARAGCFNYRSVRWDGGARPPTKTRFDGVLVDAPCSGVGTWGRNPHARWTTEPQDVVELADVQANLLHHVAPSVKPGGKLVYSVCTLTVEETEGVAGRFGESHPEFTPLAGVNPLQPRGEARAQHWLWPQQHGGNGMFVAVWQRTA